MKTDPQALHLLLVSFVGNNRWSGMGKWTHSVAEQLRNRGHAVDLWFQDDFPRVAKMGRLAALLFPVLLAFRLALRGRRYDAIVVHEPSGYWYGLLRRVVPGLAPMIAMSHGVESRRFELLVDATRQGYAGVSRGSRVKTPAMRLWQADGTLRRSDHVICLSEYDRGYLHRRLGIPTDQISLMINGVDSGQFTPSPGSGTGRRVLFVAGWLDAKGSYTLPRLWQRVIDRHPDARLTMLGTGAGEADVLRDFDEALHATIRVIPRLTEVDAVAKQFQQHDIFLMPSLNEGSPLALLEAMAAALPAVAGRAGGIPEIVEHGVNGLLFDPLNPERGAEELIRLLDDEDLRRTIAKNARERAEELNWSQAADTLLQAVHSTLGTESDTLAAASAE